MRILHIFDHSLPKQSGYTFRSRAILAHQHALGWQTAHVTSPKHAAEGQMDEEADGLVFHRSEQPDALASRLPGLRELAMIGATARRAIAVGRAFKPDIVHAHSPVLNAMAAAKVGRALGVPVVYEIRAFWEDAAASHGTCREGDLRYRLTQYLETRAARRADGLTVICDGLRQDLIRRGIDAGKITVIPNAVDIAQFSGPLPPEPALAAQLGLTNKPVLGFIGSFYDYEGLDLLIAAMPQMLAHNPDIRLLLVGGGPRDQALRAQAAALDLQQQIIFTGRVPHGDVGRYYALTDIFVYPRKNIRLTDLVTPLKPLEAMAQHKLVAASDIGGHRELIRDGDTGLLFKPDDPQALAQAIVDLLARRADWPAFWARGRAFVEQSRNWQVSVANYVPLYERLASAAKISRNSAN